MAHVLVEQCPGREVLQLNTVVTGSLRVQRTQNTQAVFSLAAIYGYPEHLKRFCVCEVGCAFSMEEELWMAGPNVAKARSSG